MCLRNIFTFFITVNVKFAQYYFQHHVIVYELLRTEAMSGGHQPAFVQEGPPAKYVGPLSSPNPPEAGLSESEANCDYTVCTAAYLASNELGADPSSPTPHPPPPGAPACPCVFRLLIISVRNTLTGSQVKGEQHVKSNFRASLRHNRRYLR